ncbi:ribosome biogenesis GTPase Der [bacterium]|nr:ribosome biogenesis GTPase Der [bacterium]
MSANIVIIGRPNVGKSTLINRILKRQKSITFDEPGVTRDILEYPAKWKGRHFKLIDTGGVYFVNSKDLNFQTDIEQLVAGVFEKASQIVLLTDGHGGLHPIDSSIAQQLRPYRKKVCVAVNKVDDPAQIQLAAEFYQLGFGTPFPISATHGTGLDKLMAHCISTFIDTESPDAESAIRVALAGRPNVGKSSLINAILNQDRVIVSPQAGTTRDAVEIDFSFQDYRYILIDTAGIRKSGKVADGVEYYSVLRSKSAINEADITVVILDATDLLREQDKRIISSVLDAGKRLIIFVNKWDAISSPSITKDLIKKQLTETFPALEFYPCIIGSALERDNVTKLFDWIPKVVTEGQTRIQTSELNQFFDAVIRRNPPPSKGAKPVKVFYGTQVETNPPEFVLFVNHPRLIHQDYERYLERRLRSYFPCFLGNPIKITYKSRQTKSENATPS